ncbi:MAG: nucleotidyltransferase domain-containing protein [Candidatus Eremiobacteraeota bacterium]|nr:nucleotidyltransferase domain-containing protein [Candidatus Eremiobacteraeota bacterium]
MEYGRNSCLEDFFLLNLWGGSKAGCYPLQGEAWGELPGKIDMDRYRKEWDALALREDEENERRRLQAIDFAKVIKDILVNEFDVERVFLFGSALREKSFREDSDIDIGVEGLPVPLYFKALARLTMESPFPVDLKPLEEVKQAFRDSIMKGTVLYEKRKAS